MTLLPSNEIPPEQPNLPHGETNLPSANPNWLQLPVTRTQQAPLPWEQQTYRDTSLDNQKDPAIALKANMQDILTMPVAQQEALIAIWPHCWLQPSPYVSGHVVCSLRDVVTHLTGTIQEQVKEQGRVDRAGAAERRTARQQRNAEDEAHGKAYIAWTEDCIKRKNWIAGKVDEHRRRVAARAAAQAEWDAVRVQWDAYVDAAQTEAQAAKATAPPPRPVR